MDHHTEGEELRSSLEARDADRGMEKTTFAGNYGGKGVADRKPLQAGWGKREGVNLLHGPV